jgi:putative nucleotidyltransferase with HDIG domain
VATTYPVEEVNKDLPFQVVSLLISFVLYISLVVYGYPYLGIIAGSAAAIPVLVIAWHTGLAGGLIATFLSISANMGLLLLAGASPMENPVGLIFNTLIIALNGISVGLISDTRSDLSREVVRRLDAERALHSLNTRLEDRVRLRTRELSRLNTQLQVELQARRRAQAGLQYRGSILETIAEIAEDTLKADKYVEPIPDMLASLGKAAQVERVRLFQNVPSLHKSDLLYTLRQEWVAAPRFREASPFPLTSYKRSGMQRWQKELGEGRIVSGNVRDLRAEERRSLEKEGILSILVMPIFAGPHWWGALSLASLTSRRKWGVEVDALRAAADILGAHIQREAEYERTLLGWAKALELRDEDTEGHTQRVTRIAVTLAEKLGYNDSEITDIRRGALLHDIGKMGVPDAVLNKPGPLNDQEWKIMKQHPVYARDMLAPIVFLHDALPIPYSHHERWDGSGYPLKLRGKRIPAAARLFALVDVWDALTSNRPYRKAWSGQRAADFLQENAGKLFDPNFTPQFIELMREIGELKS